jgi:Kef-type K+ transport system membrane component KefB
MRRWVPFGLYVLVFVVPVFLMAGWVLLVTSQPAEVRLFGSAVLLLTGLWILWRVWTTLGRPRNPPSSN